MGDKARIGVIGAGWWAVVNHIPALQRRPDCEVVAVNRLGAAELQAVKETFGIAAAYEDWRQMLDEVPMDGVVISSPHILHYEHARAALEKGCHVMVEKPLTTDANEARALVALAAEVGRQIVVPHGWNFQPFTEAARRLAPGVGRVEHVMLHKANALEDLFAGEPMIETEGAMFRPPPSTWADPKRAGGFGWGQTVHALGLMFRIIDIEPAEVYALTGASPTGVDYYHAATIRFVNGATGALSGAATLPKGRKTQIDLRVFGSEGMLLVDIERERVELRRRDGRDEVVDLKDGDGLYECESPLGFFVDLCLGRPVDNPADGVVGQRSVEVLDAMYRSAASGRPEKV